MTTTTTYTKIVDEEADNERLASAGDNEIVE